MKIYRIAQPLRFRGQPIDPEQSQEFDVEEVDDQHIYDFVEEVDRQYYKILNEYYDRKRKKGNMMSWQVIPFARLRKIWNDYAKTGIVRDIKGMHDIADQMINILARLNASHNLSGHGNMSDETIQETTGLKMPKGDNIDFYFRFLETPYGSPVSDYGLPKLNELSSKLMMSRTAEQQLFWVDQMLNVVHQRGDLAALFIEGGTKALDTLKWDGAPRQ